MKPERVIRNPHYLEYLKFTLLTRIKKIMGGLVLRLQCLAALFVSTPVFLRWEKDSLSSNHEEYTSLLLVDLPLKSFRKHVFASNCEELMGELILNTWIQPYEIGQESWLVQHSLSDLNNYLVSRNCETR